MGAVGFGVWDGGKRKFDMVEVGVWWWIKSGVTSWVSLVL